MRFFGSGVRKLCIYYLSLSHLGWIHTTIGFVHVCSAVSFVVLLVEMVVVVVFFFCRGI
jgi:hypothetical protein